MKKSLAAVIITTVLTPCYSFAYDGWSNLAKIDTYRVRAEGYILVKQEVANPTFPKNCDDTSWLQLKTEDKLLSQYVFSSILASYSTQIPVKFELQGCSNGGTSGNPVIVGISVD